MSSLDNDAVLRYILEHLKTIVQREDDGVPIAHLQRLLERLPARALGRFEPTAATIRLAIRTFPGAIDMHADGRVHACAKSSRILRPAPPVNHAVIPPIHETPKSGTPARVIAEGRITAITEGDCGFILTHRPVQYSVFCHLSAASGWPAGSGGPKVGDPVEVEVVRGSAGQNCKYQAKFVRYAKNTTPVEAPRGPDDKRVISDRVGVISFIRPDRGEIRFGDGDDQKAFFDKKSMPKALLRPGEKLMDVFMVGEKVCFEAQPYLKTDGPYKWYATMVGTVQRGGGSVVFDDGDPVCFPQTATEKRTEKVELPSNGVASLRTRPASCSAGAEHATAQEQKQRNTAVRELDFKVQRPRNHNDVTHDSSMGPARHWLTNEARVPDKTSLQHPRNHNDVTHDSSMGPARHWPSREAQVPERTSLQRPRNNDVTHDSSMGPAQHWPTREAQVPERPSQQCPRNHYYVAPTNLMGPAKHGPTSEAQVLERPSQQRPRNHYDVAHDSSMSSARHGPTREERVPERPSQQRPRNHYDVGPTSLMGPARHGPTSEAQVPERPSQQRSQNHYDVRQTSLLGPAGHGPTSEAQVPERPSQQRSQNHYDVRPTSLLGPARHGPTSEAQVPERPSQQRSQNHYDVRPTSLLGPARHGPTSEAQVPERPSQQRSRSRYDATHDDSSMVPARHGPAREPQVPERPSQQRPRNHYDVSPTSLVSPAQHWPTSEAEVPKRPSQQRPQNQYDVAPTSLVGPAQHGPTSEARVPERPSQQRPRNHHDVAPTSLVGPAQHWPTSEAQVPERPSQQCPWNRNDVTEDSSTSLARHRPTNEAQVSERHSQNLSKRRSLSPGEQFETPGRAAGVVHPGGGVFNLETARQIAAIIESTLLETFREELTLVLSEELGLTATELQMLKDASKRPTMN